MDVFHPKMVTRIALIYLEEAVLDVLFKARQEHGGLQPAEISKLIGIPSSSPRLEGSASPIVRGILDRLESRGLVRQEPPEPRAPWEFTVKGIEYQLGKYHANVR